MGTVRAEHAGVTDLALDMRKIPVKAARELATVTRKNAERGNKNAKSFARESSGSHGKHYPKSFTVEALSPLSYEYGPDASMPQGGMSFENGSRKQPPHHDLAKSADLVAAFFPRDVGKVVDRLFWPR